jgi:hypothetical protein
MTGRRYYLTTRGAWQRHSARFANSHWIALSETSNDSSPVLALIEADEGAHLALEGDAAFEALPPPFAQKSISNAAQTALAAHGISPGATTFDVAEAVGRTNPLLRYSVF